MIRIIVFGGAVAISAAVGALLALNRTTPRASAHALHSSAPAPPSTAVPQQVQNSEVAPAPVPAASASPYYSQRISTCEGIQSNANFRAYPSFAPASIVGVIPNGAEVLLTGRVVQSEGEVWYQAIAPNGQPGWIASCFVDSYQ
jgi:hypothetical protein